MSKSVFDQELILPGIITDIVSDYNAGYDISQFGSTDSVVVIGTAFDGPVGKPIKVYSPEHARYVFGKTFDFKTKREASLVPEILSCWDRGCRTIYAVRVAGEEIYKDYDLAVPVDCKLRVSGIFASNQNKDVYFQYVSEDRDLNTEAVIKIFKNASRATIEEKLLGRVIKENSILINSIELNSNWNITKSTRLIDFIKMFNTYKYNNVLKLSLVNSDGSDISDTVLAQSVTVGDMFAGVYFVGRDKNGPTVTPKTKKTSRLILDANKDLVYEGFTGDVYSTLEYNTDITKPLPIYHTKLSDLAASLGSAVSMTKIFDFLEIPGKVDSVWEKDKKDYEKVGISDFEMYKILGSGFANTCKIIETSPNSNVYKVVEVNDVLDPNRVSPIVDGIYSTLENLKSDYRVLVGKYADTTLNAPLPSKDEFLKSNPKNNIAFKKGTKNIIDAFAKLDAKDLSPAKTYEFELKLVDSSSDLFNRELLINNLYKEEGKNIVAYNLPLESSVGTAFEASTAKYILINSNDELIVFSKGTGENANLEAQGYLLDLLKENTDCFSTILKNDDKNLVTINLANAESTTIMELIAKLNECEKLSELFEFSISAEVSEEEKYDYISTAIDVDVKTTIVDRESPRYDTNLYIPYKTTDNFARQLAQHSIYTALKTAPTHAVIGVSKLASDNLNAIAAKVDKLLKTDYNLYAKKSNGNDMLDKDNMPYPIGRAISITSFQHNVEAENYTYLTTGAASYAGMVSALAIDQSSTSQPISLTNLSYELTNYQLSKLTQAGYVTVKNSYTKGYVITDGVTMAPATSPFRRLSVTRIINAVDETIRAAAEPFIGKQNHLANRNSLQTAIKSKLDTMLDSLIEKYDFRLVVDKAAQRMGIIEIEYTIIPIYEIREVRNRVSVRDSE